MKFNILRQTLYEIKVRPMAAFVTLTGTALAIFLMMMVLMIRNSTIVELAPESRRGDMLFGMNLEIRRIDGKNGNAGSAPLSLKTAERLYGNLDGIDMVSYYSEMIRKVDVARKGGQSVMLWQRYGDADFWKLFDHTFVAGRPYDDAMERSGEKVVVLSEDAVRAVLGVSPEEAVSQTVYIGWKPYRIIGVVKSSSPLASHAYGQVFVPSALADQNYWMEEFGIFSVAMLKKPGVSDDYIASQVKTRYADLSTSLKTNGQEAVYHEQPYNQKMAAASEGTNMTPDTSEDDRSAIIVYLLLILVPAVNMSSMTQSRLKRRMAEIGVRRAYGATRVRIMLEILSENFVVTLIGGAIGLIFSICGALVLSDTIFAGAISAATDVALDIPWQVIFRWHYFILALAACFILNILSAGIPAWRAASASPVDALGGMSREK